MNPILSKEIRKSAEKQSEFCRVFSNSQRILILWFLAEEEQTVTEIARAIGTSLQNVSQHLRLMEMSNIVKSRRVSRNIYYRIADNELLSKCMVQNIRFLNTSNP